MPYLLCNGRGLGNAYNNFSGNIIPSIMLGTTNYKLSCWAAYGDASLMDWYITPSYLGVLKVTGAVATSLTLGTGSINDIMLFTDGTWYLYHDGYYTYLSKKLGAGTNAGLGATDEYYVLTTSYSASTYPFLGVYVPHGTATATVTIELGDAGYFKRDNTSSIWVNPNQSTHWGIYVGHGDFTGMTLYVGLKKYTVTIASVAYLYGELYSGSFLDINKVNASETKVALGSPWNCDNWKLDAAVPVAFVGMGKPYTTVEYQYTYENGMIIHDGAYLANTQHMARK